MPVDADRRRWLASAAASAAGVGSIAAGWLGAAAAPAAAQAVPQAAAQTTAARAMPAPSAPTERATWPTGPIRILLVYPPGGVSDVILRLLADRLSVALATPVRVEYRPGASGSLGLEALAAAAPDGHTLAFSATSPLTLYPQLARVHYDPLHDFMPVASVMLTPSLLVGTPAFAGHSAADLLAAARAAPGRLRWATTGAGTTGHLVMTQWQRATGAEVTHIPYKGGGQQLTDALAGHFELLSTNVAAAQLQHIRSGRFKPLALGAPQRLASLPQVPTWAELGLASANLASVFGLLAPAGTPAAVVERLNAEVNQALALPLLRDRLRAADNLPTGGSADDFAQLIRREHAQHRVLLQQAPIKLE
jgi:tripartite-type tricarboxylate transporter receptor subunit TctC